MTWFNYALILFLIMDPFGNISSFTSQLQGITPERKRRVILREMGIALIVMIVFNYVGEFVFGVLKISESAVRLASGVILFLIAIKILFPSIDSLRANLPSGEPFITPLAIPLVAGPSLIATIMLFSTFKDNQPQLLFAILIAWAFASLIFLMGDYLQRILTTSGLVACERLMGMVLALLAIQRFLEGLHQFVKLCK
jgi:multiple antibiotic resistance protein